MKYFISLLILIGFVAISSDNIAYGLWMPETPQGLLEQSQTVFVGTITTVNVLEFERTNTYNVEENGISRLIVENYTQSLDQYTVNIEEFLKNPQEYNVITMLEATVSGPGRSVSIGGFELGDRVLFYVPKLDGANQYSPESFKIPKHCDARDVLAQKKLQMTEDFTVKQNGIKVDYGNFTANKPIEFVFSKDVGTLEGKSFDVAVVISKNAGNKLEQILSQEIHAESKPCEWIASATWGFTPEKGDYKMSLLIKQDNGTDYEYSGFSVRSDIPNNLPSPLKQFKSGIPNYKITCKEGLKLLIRTNDGPAACVKPDTATELQTRWHKMDSKSNNSEINTMCMTLEKSKDTATFFKVPSYLPDGYSFKCSFSGTPYESYMIFHNKKIPDELDLRIEQLILDGAIFIHQTDEKSAVGEKEFATYGTAEQRIQETYDSVINGNPSLKPQLIRINGMLAYAVDSCADCGMQTANFTDGTVIQKSTSSETRIKFIDENGVSYMLETTLPLSELIKVAESLQ